MVYDIYGQRVNGSGAVQWGANGVALCTAAGGQVNKSIVPEGTGGALVVWQDGHNGSRNNDIYAVRARSDGLVTAVPLAGGQKLEPGLAWPNPFNRQVSIAFSLSKPTTARMEAVDVAGRQVWSVPAQFLPAGRHSLAWSGETEVGTAAAAGI